MDKRTYLSVDLETCFAGHRTSRSEAEKEHARSASDSSNSRSWMTCKTYLPEASPPLVNLCGKQTPIRSISMQSNLTDERHADESKGQLKQSRQRR
jgi:hypothetical protein